MKITIKKLEIFKTTPTAHPSTAPSQTDANEYWEGKIHYLRSDIYIFVWVVYNVLAKMRFNAV